MEDQVARLYYRLDGVDLAVEIPADSFCDIGRDAGSKLRIDPLDKTASRRHAIIRADKKGRCTLLPVSMTTVTLRNGRPIAAETRLVDGDRIGIGQMTLRFDAPPAFAGQAGDIVEEVTTAVLVDSLVTILVVDIRNYSILAQEVGEAAIGRLMRRFNAEAGAILEKFGAFQPRYLGDAVMVPWHHGAADRVATIDLADIGRAVAAYLALAAMTARINAEMDLPRPLSIGGGINTGHAVVGNLGNAGQADFNALGEAVNRAFRLEAATRMLDADLIIGRACLDFLSGPFPFRADYPVTTVTLKGYATPQYALVLKADDLPLLAEKLLGAG